MECMVIIIVKTKALINSNRKYNVMYVRTYLMSHIIDFPLVDHKIVD